MGTTVEDANNAQAAGAAATGTASITPTLPSPMTNGESRAFVLATHTHAYGTTPTGWTALYKDLVIGTGAAGSASGQRLESCFYRDKDAGWSTMPAFVLSSGTNRTHALMSMSLLKTLGSTWDTPTYTTTPAVDYGTANTAYATGASSSFTTHANALLMSLTAKNVNTSFTAASEAWAQSGATLGALTRRADGGLGTGNGFGVGINVNTSLVTAGAAATLAMTATGTGNMQGGTVWIEQTETAPAGANTGAFFPMF